MSEFLEQDGLFLLARAVKSFEEKEKMEMADVVCQTKLVTSIRAVANNKHGLDALIEANGGQVVRTLVGVISRSTNVMMRTQVVELMAATCIYSLRGHEVVLEALGEASGGEAIVAADGAMRFAVVAKWLREDSEATSKAAVVSLINSIISAPPAVEDRVKLRRLFTHLNVHESLEALKIEAADQREQELVSQIETFFHGFFCLLSFPFLFPFVYTHLFRRNEIRCERTPQTHDRVPGRPHVRKETFPAHLAHNLRPRQESGRGLQSSKTEAHWNTPRGFIHRNSSSPVADLSARTRRVTISLFFLFSLEANF